MVVDVNEYQFYEFVAVDRPLTSLDTDELRRISARAEISTTRFCNEYRWGDLRADPVALLARYFDLHLRYANWGSRRVMFKIPAATVDPGVLREYFPGNTATVTVAGEFVIVDICCDVDGADDDFDSDSGLGAALTPVRSQLLRGDLRVAYVAWLLAVQRGEIPADTIEPPVPSGLGTLTGSKPTAAFVRFLRLDPDLLAAAAEEPVEDDNEAERFGQWVETMPPRLRDRWLLRAAAYPELALGAEMLSEFRRSHPLAVRTRRSVRQLLSRAHELAERRRRPAVVNHRRWIRW